MSVDFHEHVQIKVTKCRFFLNKSLNNLLSNTIFFTLVWITIVTDTSSCDTYIFCLYIGTYFTLYWSLQSDTGVLFYLLEKLLLSLHLLANSRLTHWGIDLFSSAHDCLILMHVCGTKVFVISLGIFGKQCQSVLSHIILTLKEKHFSILSCKWMILQNVSKYCTTSLSLLKILLTQMALNIHFIYCNAIEVLRGFSR